MILSPDKIVVNGSKVPFKWEILQAWRDQAATLQKSADTAAALNIGTPAKKYFIESVLFVRTKTAATFPPDGNVALMNTDAYEWTAPAAGAYVWKVRIAVVELTGTSTRRIVTWWESNPMEFDVAFTAASPVSAAADPNKPTTPAVTVAPDDAVKVNGEQTLPKTGTTFSTMTAGASRVQAVLVLGVAASVLYAMAKEKGGFGV